MRQRERPQPQVRGRVGHHAQHELDRLDGLVDHQLAEPVVVVPAPILPAMVVPAVPPALLVRLRLGQRRVLHVARRALLGLAVDDAGLGAEQHGDAGEGQQEEKYLVCCGLWCLGGGRGGSRSSSRLHTAKPSPPPTITNRSTAALCCESKQRTRYLQRGLAPKHGLDDRARGEGDGDEGVDEVGRLAAPTRAAVLQGAHVGGGALPHHAGLGGAGLGREAVDVAGGGGVGAGRVLERVGVQELARGREHALLPVDGPLGEDEHHHVPRKG